MKQLVTARKIRYRGIPKPRLCRADRLAFPIRDGIPVMLANEARSTDAEGDPA